MGTEVRRIPNISRFQPPSVFRGLVCVGGTVVWSRRRIPFGLRRLHERSPARGACCFLRFSASEIRMYITRFSVVFNASFVLVSPRAHPNIKTTFLLFCWFSNQLRFGVLSSIWRYNTTRESQSKREREIES